MAPAATRVAVSRAEERPPPRYRAGRIWLIGEIGMAGTKLVLDLGIVLRALIVILDQQRDRVPASLPAGLRMRHHAGKDLHRVGSWRWVVKRDCPAGGDRDRAGCLRPSAAAAAGSHRPRRRSRPMALAEGGDPEHVAEGVKDISDNPQGC